MLAYRYDEETKIYVGTINCQLNPIATKREGRDVFLTPANSVLVEPLQAKEGFNVVWNDNAWEYVEIPQEEEQQAEPTEEEQKAQQIAQLKYELSSLDYKTIKRMQGVLSDEEWEQTKAKCAELRAKINELEQ